MTRRPGPKSGRAQGLVSTNSTLARRTNHEAPDCWYCYEEDFVTPPSKTANAALSGYDYDTNWYVDSGSTDHITGELEKLTVRDKYKGQDLVHTAGGAGSGNEEGHT